VLQNVNIFGRNKYVQTKLLRKQFMVVAVA